MNSPSPHTPGERIDLTGSQARGAIDLSIGQTNPQHEHQADDRDTIKSALKLKKASLGIARRNAIENRHLPVAPKILLGQELYPEPSDEAVVPYQKSVANTYHDAIVDYRIAQIQDDIDGRDNDSLVSYIASEYDSFINQWIESDHISAKDGGEDEEHRKKRRNSLGLHALSNMAGGVITGALVHTAGGNTLTTLAATVGAGAAAFSTKTLAMRKGEYPTVHDAGDAGITTEGNTNFIRKIGTLTHVASQEDLTRSIHKDITKNLNLIGFKPESVPSETDIRTAISVFISGKNSDKSLKSADRAKFIQIANDLEAKLTGTLTDEQLERIHIETAMALHDLERETHNSKKFNKWKGKKRLGSAALALAIGLGVTSIAGGKYEDNQRQEQFEKKQNTPQKPTAEIQDPDMLPEQEKKSIEEDFNDNLGN